MNNNCEMMRDLLPLYLDDVCSESSRRAVEAHLAQCNDCSALLERMRGRELEAAMDEEKKGVLISRSEFFQRKSAIAGAIIGGIFAIPVLVCFIVDLAAGGGLSWFFIVLASMLVAASLVVVPLIAPKHKALYTLGSFALSLMLLLGACAAVSGGKWFFTAVLPVLFGLSVIFLPFVARSKPIAKYLGNHKGAAVLGADTLLYVLMMLAIGARADDPAGFFRAALAWSLPFLLLIWAVFAVIRYLRCHGLVKGGICVALVGAFILTADWLIAAVAGTNAKFPAFRPSEWSYYTANDNVKWIIMIAAGAVGLVLALFGFLAGRGKKTVSDQ